MRLWLSILFVASATAAVIQRQETNIVGSATAQPGASIVSQIATISAQPSSTVASNWTLPSDILSVSSTPTIQLAVLAASCTPKTICVDKISPCGKRYGGSVLTISGPCIGGLLTGHSCYDKFYCDGNTSPYPVPTCIPTT